MLLTSFIIIEILALIVCAIFGYKWALNPSGNYEPWLFLAGLTFIAIEILRRYREQLFSKDGKVSTIIPWVRHWLNRPIIVPHQRNNRWHMGKTGDQQPSMQIVSYWYVTNQYDFPIKILNAHIKKPLVSGHVMTKDTSSVCHGSYSIPPRSTTDLHANFWLHPPINKVGKDIKLDIIFTDQLGQKRKIKNVNFESDKKKRPSPKILEIEAVYKLEHEVEKKIASVLKDEINRYKRYGRRSGELGSVHAMHGNTKIKSIYQDSWTSSRSGERQEIVTDSASTKVLSENGDALVKYFTNGCDEKELFVISLLSRLNKEKEYYCVSYLIFYILIRINRLNEVLDVAKVSLQTNSNLLHKILKIKPKEKLLEPHQRNGFSDALGLLSGLLKFEHTSFSDEQLDLIEEFVESIDEHSFKIIEKIYSIRALRVGN